MRGRRAEPGAAGHRPRVLLRAVLPSVLLLMAIAVPVTLFLLRPGPPVRPATDSRPWVVTTRVQPAPTSFEIVTHGTVVPKKEVSVTAEVAGKVIRVSDDCEAGRFVTQGALLAEIDPIRYELEVQRVKIEAEQLKFDVAKLEMERQNTLRLVAIAEEDLAISQREQTRIEGLFRSNSASESDRDQAASTVMRYRSTLEQLNNTLRLWQQSMDRLMAQIDLTQTRLKLAELDVEKTKIRAPVDGYIVEDLVETSTYLQTGSVVCRIEDRSAVEVRCNLRIDDLYWLARPPVNGASPNTQDLSSLYQAPRAPAIVTYRVAGETYRWDRSFLSRYEGTGVDEKTRTIPCRVEIEQPDEARMTGDVPTLVRGMFVTVRLLADPRHPLLEIPYAALRPNDEVWVVRSDTLRILRVRIAKMLDNAALVHHEGLDLKPGDEVVVSPMSVAVDGMKVRRSRILDDARQPIDAGPSPQPGEVPAAEAAGNEAPARKDAGAGG